MKDIRLRNAIKKGSKVRWTDSLTSPGKANGLQHHGEVNPNWSVASDGKQKHGGGMNECVYLPFTYRLEPSGFLSSFGPEDHQTIFDVRPKAFQRPSGLARVLVGKCMKILDELCKELVN
jgi:hypothetical protein